MTYARAMNDGSTPRATLVPWRAGVALIGSVLIAGGLLNEDKLIWAAIALAYIGVLLARDERAIDPQHWASESDQRLANVGRIVIAAFLLCALGGVALGLACACWRRDLSRPAGPQPTRRQQRRIHRSRQTQPFQSADLDLRWRLADPRRDRADTPLRGWTHPRQPDHTTRQACRVTRAADLEVGGQPDRLSAR
jgi:hypothetical protein